MADPARFRVLEPPDDLATAANMASFFAVIAGDGTVSSVVETTCATTVSVRSVAAKATPIATPLAAASSLGTIGLSPEEATASSSESAPAATSVSPLRRAETVRPVPSSTSAEATSAVTETSPAALAAEPRTFDFSVSPARPAASTRVEAESVASTVRKAGAHRPRGML